MAHTRRTLKLTTENRLAQSPGKFDFRALVDVRAVPNIRVDGPVDMFFPAWDLTLDSSGRIALSRGAEATAQNVANEARLFTNDAYFIQDQGIPHFVIDLGQRLTSSVVRSYLHLAAIKVADVREILNIEVENLDAETRVLTGSIEFNTIGDASGAITTYF